MLCANYWVALKFGEKKKFLQQLEEDQRIIIVTNLGNVIKS